MSKKSKLEELQQTSEPEIDDEVSTDATVESETGDEAQDETEVEEHPRHDKHAPKKVGIKHDKHAPKARQK